MSNADQPHGRRKPGRRTRRGLEPADESLPAPTARRIGHVHATITINPHDPSPAQRSPSPAAHPQGERRVAAVVDLTNDDEEPQEHQLVNPIIRHLFTIPFIMGSFFDQRQARTPDQRDHSSLMDLYGGGYWSKRRKEAKKKEEEANGDVARPAPPKIRLTQRSPAPLTSSNDTVANPSNVHNGHSHTSNSPTGSNGHHHATRSATASRRVPAAPGAAPRGQAPTANRNENLGNLSVIERLQAIARLRNSDPGNRSVHLDDVEPFGDLDDSSDSTPPVVENLGHLSVIDRLREIARLRNADPRNVASNSDDSGPYDLDDSTDTTPPAAVHHHNPIHAATPEIRPAIEDDDDIQVVGVSRAPSRSAPPSTAMDVDQDAKGVSEEDQRTAATMEAPTNSLFKDYKCVVCLDSVVDATATFCGHIFCEGCILNAIESNHRCPTCRCKLSAKEIHPLFV